MKLKIPYRSTLAVLGAVIVLALGCKKERESGDFRIEFSEGFTVSGSDIVVYDISHGGSHRVRLKAGSVPQADFSTGGFTVWVNDEAIYSGVVWPLYSSSLPRGVAIYPLFFGDDPQMSISFMIDQDENGNPIPDPRNDRRILQVLDRLGKLKR